MSAANFYDEFLASQIRSGINDRIYNLYRKVLRLGLKTDENILEIGCGIGTLTFLISRKVKKGVVEAFDPSPKSIEFARQKIRQSNVHFFVGDAVDYRPQHSWSFDKILLFDVLEHIPEEKHSAVFELCDTYLQPDGLLLINLPNPDYILFDRIHQPEILQQLDQPIFLRSLFPKLEEANFELLSFEKHSVWVKNDYHFLMLRKKREFTEEYLNRSRTFFQKLTHRLQREVRKLKYRFP